MAGVNEATHAMVEAERRAAEPNPAIITKYRAYTAGKQPITLTEDQKNILKGVLSNMYSDNICRRIVSTVSTRVKVDRFEVANTKVESYIKELYVTNWLRNLANRVHFSTVRDGNHAVSLEWDNLKKAVRIQRELWWDGKRGTWVKYDRLGAPEWAVKDWQVKVPTGDNKALMDATRRVIWYPDRIERYILKGSGWQWYPLPAMTDKAGNILRPAEAPGPVPWTRNGQIGGVPLGVPVIHFARMEQPEDDAQDTTGACDHYGTSILAGGLLGNQDTINDLHMSLLAAARMTGFQTVWATGVPLTDDNGKPVVLTMETGRMLHTDQPGPGAAFGVLQAGSVEQILKALETEHQAAATSTNTPIHVIAGDWPSGEALLQADRPLIDQAEALADSFGPAWASVMHRATEMANTFGGAALDEKPLISTIFRPADRNDRVTLAAVAAAVAPFVSNREVLRILRYSPEQIEQIMAEREKESAFVVPGDGEAVPGGDTGDSGTTPADEGDLAG